MKWTRLRLPSVLACVFALAACAEDGREPLAPNSATPDDHAALYAPPGEGEDISDQYLIVFREDVADTRALAEQLVAAHGGTIHYVYRAVLKGFGATLPPAAVDAIRRHPSVDHVSPAQRIRAVGTQSSPPWGLDRIDQRSLPLSGSYTYGETGYGVRAYIMDSGIRTSHNDFGGRASVGRDVFGGNGQDCNGHGTHVAGTVGGATYGVAKQVSLVAVRVLDCSGGGTILGLIDGLDWIRLNHVKPAVVNISIAVVQNGSETTNSDVDNAVSNLINAGVTVVVAGGNTNKSACNVSPARVGSALTVGATNSSDYRWVWSSSQGSNYGSCLDLFAPGEQVTSTYYRSDTDYYTDTGTSMAAPHVAGAAATYLQRNSGASPATIRDVLMQNMTTGKLQNIGSGSPNYLLFSQLTNPVSASIEGPYFVNTEGTYSWEAMPSGGNGSYTYRWRVLWTNTYTWQTLGTQKVQELYLTGYDGDFELEVEVYSGNVKTLTSTFVCNFIPPNDAACA